MLRNVSDSTSPEMDNPQSLAAIEGLRQQLGHVMDVLGDIKNDLKQVVQLDKEVSEIKIKQGGIQKNVELLWSRHDQSKDREERIKESIGSVRNSHDEFKHTFNGGMKVFLGVFSIFQTLTIGSVIWIFNHITESDTTNRLHEQRIVQLESQLKEKK